MKIKTDVNIKDSLKNNGIVSIITNNLKRTFTKVDSYLIKNNMDSYTINTLFDKCHINDVYNRSRFISDFNFKSVKDKTVYMKIYFFKDAYFDPEVRIFSNVPSLKLAKKGSDCCIIAKNNNLKY